MTLQRRSKWFTAAICNIMWNIRQIIPCTTKWRFRCVKCERIHEWHGFAGNVNKSWYNYTANAGGTRSLFYQSLLHSACMPDTTASIVGRTWHTAHTDSTQLLFMPRSRDTYGRYRTGFTGSRNSGQDGGQDYFHFQSRIGRISLLPAFTVWGY